MNNILNIEIQGSTEEKLGFKIDGSHVSPIGLVVEEKFDGIGDLIRLSAFTLFLERRHLDAGMPECCVEGKNIRRLAILLLRNRNINRIIVLQNQEKKHLEHTIENILSLISGTITDEKLDYLWTRGRFARYKFLKEELKSVFAKVTEGLEVITYSDSDLPEKIDKLIREMRKHVLEIESVVPSPAEKRSFFISPSSLDDYMMPQTALNQSIAPNNVLCAQDVITLFRRCEQILFAYGYEVKDYCDIGRWQLGQEITLRLDINKKDSDLEWKKTLESFIIDIETFLGNIGIRNCKEAYINSEFHNRLFESKEGRKIRHEDFIERVGDDIENKRFGDSNALVLLVEEDDLLTKRKSKIGWSGIRCYMRPQEDYVLLSLSHDLRSIDLYDGFPVNLFFCLEYSIRFARGLMEKLPHELKLRVRLDHLRFTIQYLHAYLDDVPARLVRNL